MTELTYKYTISLTAYDIYIYNMYIPTTPVVPYKDPSTSHYYYHYVGISI